MGYSPAPTKQTRLVLPDASLLGPGDVPINAGNNVSVTRLANGLVVASNPPSSLRVASAFGPGAAVARTLQKAGGITNPVVQALDVFLGTAPVGTDANNHANVRVSGSGAGGPIVVPLSVGVNEFHLGLFDLTTPLARAVVTNSPAASTAEFTADKFTVTTQTLVRALDYAWLNGTPPSNPATAMVRAGIATGVAAGTSCLNPNWLVDANGNLCFVDVPLATVQATSGHVLFTLPGTAGFTLNVGTTYWAILGEWDTATNKPVLFSQSGGNRHTVSAVANGTTQSGNFATFSPGNGTFADDMAGAGLGLFANPIFNSPPGVSLYGAVMGTPLTGLVVIDQTITGAPPGTTGSDANVLVQC